MTFGIKRWYNTFLWSEKTKEEKLKWYMMITTVTILLLIGALVSTILIYEGKIGKVCNTSNCVKKSSRVLELIDSNINPCEDFYSFSCGAYLTTEANRDKNTLIDQTNSLNDAVKVILTDSISYTEPRFLAFPKMLYRSCMNQEQIVADGLRPIQEFMKRFGEWPVVVGEKWNEESFDWKNMVREFRIHGLPFGNIIQVNWIDDDINAILLLREGETYLSDTINGNSSKFASEYKDLLIKIALSFGAEKETAIKDMEDVLEFENNIVKIALINRTTEKTYINNLNDSYPYIDWIKFLRSDLGLNANRNEVIMIVPSYFERLGALLNATNKRVIANYMMAKIYLFSIDLLPRAIIYGGELEPYEERQKICIDFIRSHLWLAVAALYHQKYFDESIVQGVQTMVELIRQELINNLKHYKWMNDGARNVALEKLLSMNVQIAFPFELKDLAKLDNFYSDLGARTSRGNWKWIPNFFTGATQALKKAIHAVSDISQHSLKIVNQTIVSTREPIHKSADTLNIIARKVHTRNAISRFNLQRMHTNVKWLEVSDQIKSRTYYDPKNNMLDIRAGILSEEFYSSGVPNYMNFGALGTLIAHEIFHAVDNRGITPSNANIQQKWWKVKGKKQHERKFQCLVDQYSLYHEPLTQQKLNGESTFEENLADNIGVTTAYQAYKEWVKQNGAEPKLPGIDLSSVQLFWVAFAQTQCANPTFNKLYKQVQHGEQVPERFRVIGSISNSDDFSSDFKCSPNSEMNRKRKCKF